MIDRPTTRRLKASRHDGAPDAGLAGRILGVDVGRETEARGPPAAPSVSPARPPYRTCTTPASGSPRVHAVCAGDSGSSLVHGVGIRVCQVAVVADRGP